MSCCEAQLWYATHCAAFTSSCRRTAGEEEFLKRQVPVLFSKKLFRTLGWRVALFWRHHPTGDLITCKQFVSAAPMAFHNFNNTAEDFTFLGSKFTSITRDEWVRIIGTNPGKDLSIVCGVREEYDWGRLCRQLDMASPADFLAVQLEAAGVSIFQEVTLRITKRFIAVGGDVFTLKKCARAAFERILTVPRFQHYFLSICEIPALKNGDDGRHSSRDQDQFTLPRCVSKKDEVEVASSVTVASPESKTKCLQLTLSSNERPQRSKSTDDAVAGLLGLAKSPASGIPSVLEYCDSEEHSRVMPKKTLQNEAKRLGTEEISDGKSPAQTSYQEFYEKHLSVWMKEDKKRHRIEDQTPKRSLKQERFLGYAPVISQREREELEEEKAKNKEIEEASKISSEDIGYVQVYFPNNCMEGEVVTAKDVGNGYFSFSNEQSPQRVQSTKVVGGQLFMYTVSKSLRKIIYPRFSRFTLMGKLIVKEPSSEWLTHCLCANDDTDSDDSNNEENCSGHGGRAASSHKKQKKEDDENGKEMKQTVAPDGYPVIDLT